MPINGQKMLSPSHLDKKSIDPIFAVSTYVICRNGTGCAIRMLNVIKGQWRSLKVKRGHNIMIEVGKKIWVEIFVPYSHITTTCDIEYLLLTYEIIGNH